LFEVIDKLRKSGVSIIYISHRLEEVFKIADRVSVLKDGQLVGEAKIGEVDMDKLISLMVGRKIDSNLYDSSRKIGKEIFRCEGIKNTKVRNISFSVHAGEIVGMYGLVGSGRTEVARAIFGADKIFSGRIFIKGKQVKIKSPVFAKKSLLSYLPDDRRNLGLAMQLSVMNNINLASYENISRFGFVDLKKERFVVGNLIKALSIKTPSMFQIVSKLSGGNQQKVVISRWLAARSDIFLMDEPTIGIDVGAKNEMYKLINNLARQGKGIIFISSHMPELIAICDRIIVMKEGQIAGEIKRQNFCEEKILKMAIENRKVEDINV